MKLACYIGLYQLTVTVVFTLCSMWQIKRGSGSADFSYLIILPVAVGLICDRRWAVLASAILGVVASFMCIGLAAVYSIFGLSGLEVSLGPFLLVEPSAVGLWNSRPAPVNGRRSKAMRRMPPDNSR